LFFASLGPFLRRIRGCFGRKSLLVFIVSSGILFSGVPGLSPSAATAVEKIYYRVKKGDCLWSIARHYRVSVDTLKQANGLRSDLIKPGQVLSIPGKGVPVGGVQPTAPKPGTSGVKLPSRSGDLVRELLDYAWSLRGVRYRWAGESPATGFDCSGFTKHVFGRFGVSLPHSAAAQSGCGIPVARDELAPGDLLLFHTYGSGIDHAAIYCGEGRFIHASSRGGCVRVDSLAENYWDTRLVGIRRVLGTGG